MILGQKIANPLSGVLVIAMLLSPQPALAEPLPDDIEKIHQHVQNNNIQQAREGVRELKQKHFSRLSVEGKTCRNNPAFILLLEAENGIRSKNKELASNYLTQLQCLASIDKTQVDVRKQRIRMQPYLLSNPQASHRCPMSLGLEQLKQAQRLQQAGQSLSAQNAMLGAACLLGPQHPQVAKQMAELSGNHAVKSVDPTPTRPQQQAGNARKAEPVSSIASKPAEAEPGRGSTKPSPPPANTERHIGLIVTVVAILAALAVVAYLLIRRRKPANASVFISYRRRDSAGWAQTIHDKLAGQLGHERIFMDLHDIPAGTDFVQFLDQTLKEVKTVLVIIGHNWEAGDRIHSEGDWVRQEIVHAINSGKQVIPILVDQRTMPSPHQLPEDLQPMTRLNAITLYPDQLEGGIRRLLKAIS